MPVPGTGVAWWDGGHLSFGIVTQDHGQRVRLILAGGKDKRVSASRIAFELGRGVTNARPGGENRDAAARSVEALAERVGSEADDVDVSLLWELAVEAEEPPAMTSLTQLALGRADGLACAAVTVALLRDGIHFTRRGARWEARPEAAVQALRVQRERDARVEVERDAFRKALRAAVRGEPFRSAASREEKRGLNALAALAIQGAEADERERQAGLELVESSGIACESPEEGAFLLLRRLGWFESDDANLAIVRYRLRTEFPAAVLESARAAATRGFSREGRADLTGLEVVTIDSAHTSEIDDALSIEPLPDGRRRVGIHIADPAAFVESGGPLDEEALTRTVTYYFPERRLPMLPGSISEQAASLVAGQPRPALSFIVDVDARGEIGGYEIARSVVRVRTRMDYAQADRAIRGDGKSSSVVPRAVADVMARRWEARERAGAITLLAPEVEVHVDPRGELSLERIDPEDPARRCVSEAMILAGAVAARWCAERGLPAVHRRQAPPTVAIEASSRATSDPVEVRALRRSLRRGEVALQPGPHFALGLEAYVQVTSPLRRYQDLVMHRQIVSALEGRPAAYDGAALQRIAAATERAELEGRRAEALADRYWLLRYLEREAGGTVDAVVVESEPRVVVQLEETLLEQPVPALSGTPAGARVRLRIEHVNARADVLRLRPESV